MTSRSSIQSVITDAQSLLTIFDLEPLDHQTVASSESQVSLAEPSNLRLLGYNQTSE